MKPLSEFLLDINPYATGCSAPAAYYGIRKAAIDFCERTRLWRHTQDFPVSGSDTVAITTPANSVLFEIELAQFNGVDLGKASTEYLDERYQWRAGALAGPPQFITQTDVNEARLVPWQDGTLTLHMYLKPSKDATQVPDFMVDQYSEMIAWGALGRILAAPGQPYSNPGMASSFAAAFAAKLDALTGANVRGQQRAPKRTKANFF